ncbi:hypothetical protein ACG7TL_007033 [Trametes sanguinea]
MLLAMNHLRAAFLRPACRAPWLAPTLPTATSFGQAHCEADVVEERFHGQRSEFFIKYASTKRLTAAVQDEAGALCGPEPEPSDVYHRRLPLYRMFCAATGFAGTPKVGMGKFEADRLVPVEDAKRIKVHFNADTSDALPWSFVPQQKFVSVLPGETSLAFYRAKNNSDKDIIGIATYNVTPDRIAPYFAKVECFCFEEQKLLAGEEVDMPLLFFIDKDVLDDPSCRNLDDIVLSYTFFRNAQGHLEPDASDEVVQASQGFAGIEMAPRVEDRKKEDNSTSS